MENNKLRVGILGNGLLGTELGRQSGWDVIGRSTHGFDITDPTTWESSLYTHEHGVVFYDKYNVLINCIAYTGTYDTDRVKHWDVNYRGTSNLAEYCNRRGIKLVQISTDYIYANSVPEASETDVPVHCNTWYGYTKLLADAHVQLHSNQHLVIRATHKKKPFKYPVAWVDQVGNFDYVDIIAEKIIELINVDASGVYNVGTRLKSMYTLATETNQIVSPSLRSDSIIPENVSMNISKLNKKLS